MAALGIGKPTVTAQNSLCLSPGDGPGFTHLGDVTAISLKYPRSDDRLFPGNQITHHINVACLEVNVLISGFDRDTEVIPHPFSEALNPHL